MDQLLEIQPIAAIEAYFEAKGHPLVVHKTHRQGHPGSKCRGFFRL